MANPTLPPMGTPAADAHDWKGNDYHCAQCGSSYHCSQCGAGSSMLGHRVGGIDGFFTCQDPDRAAKWRADFIAGRNPQVHPTTEEST